MQVQLLSWAVVRRGNGLSGLTLLTTFLVRCGSPCAAANHPEQVPSEVLSLVEVAKS